jgi:hypothetical protein
VKPCRICGQTTTFMMTPTPGAGETPFRLCLTHYRAYIAEGK